MALSCGGKGPCCHVGYSHRHCEHCDLVINTYVPVFNPWATQPFIPTYYPPISTGPGNTFINALNTGAAATQVPALGQSVSTAVPEHACTALPNGG